MYNPRSLRTLDQDGNGAEEKCTLLSPDLKNAGYWNNESPLNRMPVSRYPESLEEVQKGGCCFSVASLIVDVDAIDPCLKRLEAP